MIENISNYASNLITLVILITIIELILPINKNKKYVMFICSLIIMLSIINPILKVFGAEIDIQKEINNVHKEITDIEYKTYDSYNIDYNIYNTYVDNLKNNMIARIEDIGYEVLNVEIKVDKETYEPKNIEMNVKYKDDYIQPIVIDVFENSVENQLYEFDINKIKDILSGSYGFNKENIKINE